MDTLTAGEPTPPRPYDARGHKVLLEDDLAAHWETSVDEIVRIVHEHDALFSRRMCFRLAAPEAAAVRRQRADAPPGARHKPLAFTARGSALLASFLDSVKARASNATAARLLAVGIPPGTVFDFEFCGPDCPCGRPGAD